MKKCFTLPDLFKISGKKGEVFGMAEAALYFDGQRAVAANDYAAVWIDCPQPLQRPVLIPVADIKTALLVAPTLSVRDCNGHISVNGVRVSGLVAVDDIPGATMEMIELDRAVWHRVVRPFRFDGTRLAQVVSAAALGDLRSYLNGVYFDFAQGALVATDGRRLHIVEDAVATAALPANTIPGVVMPSTVANILAKVGGVQDIFVMQKTEDQDEIVRRAARSQAPAPGMPANTTEVVEEGPHRLICIAVANAKFRVRAVRTRNYPQYRDPFERNREHPVQMVLSAEDMPIFAAVARVSSKNRNFPGVTIRGQGRRITVSHPDRFERDLAVGYQVGEQFAATVNGDYLLAALEAASRFGSAVTMRYSRLDGRGVYIGAQDFHSVVMTMNRDEDSVQVETAETHAINPAAAT